MTNGAGLEVEWWRGAGECVTLRCRAGEVKNEMPATRGSPAA